MTPGPRSDSSSRTAIALGCVLGAVVSVQLGGALGKGLFDDVSPVGATWLRQTSAAIVLIPLALLLRRRSARSARGVRRPSSPSQWAVGLGYAGCLVVMNWAIYEAFARIPLGIGVTIEFLGPLAVAVAGSRRRLDLLWVVIAAAGIALLGIRPAPLDPVGVAFALLAGAAWAGYILLGSRLARSWEPLDALALACALGAVVLAAPAVLTSGAALLQPDVLATGALTGVLSSVLPYSLELAALGVLPAALFSILLSIEPAAAAVAGWVVLGEALSPVDWGAIACIMVASVGATIASRPRAGDQQPEVVPTETGQIPVLGAPRDDAGD